MAGNVHEEFFRASPQARIEFKEIFALGSRCIMRWTYHSLDPSGATGHTRGVDLHQPLRGAIDDRA